jgi:fumarylacetoacetase
MSEAGFGIENLPYCACDGWLGVRYGNRVLNISRLESDGRIDAGGTLSGERTLNRFMATGRVTWQRVRTRVRELLETDDIGLYLVPLDAVEPILPFEVADYVDFYSSEHHAANVGAMFRPGQPPLTPNWKHLPIGYHGRAGTVVVSGTAIVRPSGQRPTFGPSQRLDIEAEVGFVVGTGSTLGAPLTTTDLSEHVFGVVLLNDWSARDIQAFEYQPLGPFLGKSFATSISPWVVPLDALDAARVPAPPQDPPVLPYLSDDRTGYDISIEVRWNGTLVSTPPFRTMYWTPAQQLAHLTVNGANVRTGDLFASGTVSGPQPDQRGSFLELTWNGAEPVTLADGRTRTFLEDGDTVTISATAPGPGGTLIGFGDVTGVIRPAR